MEITVWLSLVAVCILGAMTPGPSLVVVLKHTLSGGRLNGFMTSISHGIGVALYALLTVLGMTLIIQETPWLFNLIKYAGALFLLWLAFKAFTAKSSLLEMDKHKSSVSLWKSCQEGFLIAFLNPKLAIFFIALFSQFISLDAGFIEKSILVLTVGIIDTLWYCIIATVLSQSHILDKLRNNVSVIEKLTGTALIAVTIRILI